MYVVVNKYYNLGDLEKTIPENVILGKVGIDPALIRYDFETLLPETRETVASIAKTLDSQTWDESLQWKRHQIWKERYDRQLEESKKKEYTFVKK